LNDHGWGRSAGASPSAPSAGAGWLIFRSESAAGGGVLEATAVRIRFAAAS
jgi:hypothetical protein